MEFDDLAARALDTSKSRGADYADIRFEVARSERIEVRNGVVATLADGTSTGYGIRALVDGAWGFAAAADLSDAGVDAAAARAVEIARAGAAIAAAASGARRARLRRRVRDADGTRPGARAAGRARRAAARGRTALHAGPDIAVGRAWLDLWRSDKNFYSTIGSRIEQQIRQTGARIEAMAVGDGDVQVRSYPGDNGLYNSGGWEVVRKRKLIEGAPRIGEEALALLRAPQCPSGTFDIILGGSQMSLQIHESCGHAAELDRVMGWEANFSGTSFLEIEQLGKLQVRLRQGQRS